MRALARNKYNRPFTLNGLGPFWPHLADGCSPAESPGQFDVSFGKTLYQLPLDIEKWDLITTTDPGKLTRRNKKSQNSEIKF